MGAYVNVGYRSANGDIKNAVGYTSDLLIFPRCPDFQLGVEDKVAALVKGRSEDVVFGPSGSVPIEEGYRFADFATRTLFDMQTFDELLGISWYQMALSVTAGNGNFERLVPNIVSVTRAAFPKEIKRRADLYSMELVTTPLPHLETLDQLWAEISGGAIAQRDSFVTLNIKLEGWKVLTFEKTKQGASAFRDQLSEIIPLNEGELGTWDRYIALLK